jgi:hypothetical protein
MNKINHTRIALIVNAIFAQGLQAKIKGMEQVPYQVGLFAEQDYRAIVSMLYTVRMDLIRMQDGADRPLQDVPREGSMDCNDAMGSDTTYSEQEAERHNLMAQASRCHAVLERHLESLAKQASSDLEEAGSKTASGGRYVLSSSTRSFKAFCGSWEDFLIDMRANAKAGTPWMLKIERAEEFVTFPHVSAQDATDEFMEYFEDENVLKTSGRAWEKLEDRFELLGQTLLNHEHMTAAFNALPKLSHDLAKADFAVACREFKQEVKNHDWWITRFMDPWALLCATGASTDLINSAEWRTKEAELRTANARLRLRETEAEMMELEALNMEAETTIALRAARNRMAQLSARNEELYNLANPKAVVKVDKQAKAEKAARLIAAPVASPRMVFSQHSSTDAMRTGSDGRVVGPRG